MNKKVRAITMITLALFFVLHIFTLVTYATPANQPVESTQESAVVQHADTVTQDTIHDINSVLFDGQVIVENKVPLVAAPYVFFSAWSLFNVITTLLVVLSTVFLSSALIKKAKTDDTSDTGRYKNKILNKVATMVLEATTVLVLLLITQDFSTPMAIFDRYSLVFALFVVLVVTTNAIGKNKTQKEIEAEYEQQDS